MCEFFFKPSTTGRMFTIKRKGKCKLKSFQLEKNIIKSVMLRSVVSSREGYSRYTVMIIEIVKRKQTKIVKSGKKVFSQLKKAVKALPVIFSNYLGLKLGNH